MSMPDLSLNALFSVEGKVVLWRREKNEHREVVAVDAPPGRLTHIRLTARDGHRFRFAVSPDGRAWRDVGDELDGSYLPPWDRGLRVALTAGGAAAPGAAFDFLRITPRRQAARAAGR